MSDGGAAHDAEAEGVGAELGDEVERIGRVTEGLGHLPALLVADDAREIDVLEGQLFAVLKARHDHACDPEKDDVGPGDQVRGGVEGLERGRFFRPAHGRKGPQPRGKPGVEHVGILLPEGGVGGGHVAAVREGTVLEGAHAVFGDGHAEGGPGGVGVGAAVVPNRDAVAPPELAGNTPVLEVAHPVFVDLAPAFRMEAHLAGADHLAGSLLGGVA